MYKSRLASWGLRKNLGGNSVKNALARLQGGSEWSAHGDPVTLPGLQATQVRRLARYLDRNPEMMRQLHGLHGEGVQMLLSRAGGSEPELATKKYRRLAPRMLRAPAHVELPDEMFRLLRAFLMAAPERSDEEVIRPPEQDEGSKCNFPRIGLRSFQAIQAFHCRMEPNLGL